MNFDCQSRIIKQVLKHVSNLRTKEVVECQIIGWQSLMEFQYETFTHG